MKFVIYIFLIIFFSGCMPVQYVSDTVKDAVRGPKDSHMVSFLKISPDGRYLVAKRKDEWNFVIYDLYNKAIVHEKKNFGISNLKFSKDSKKYFYYDKNYQTIVLKDIVSNQTLKTFPMPYPVYNIVFLPDDIRAIISVDVRKFLNKNKKNNMPIPHTLYFYDGEKLIPLRDDNVKKAKSLYKSGIYVPNNMQFFYTIDNLFKSEMDLSLNGVKDFNKYGFVKWNTSDLSVIAYYRHPEKFNWGADGGIYLYKDKSKICIKGKTGILLDADTLDVLSSDFKITSSPENWLFLLSDGGFLGQGELVCDRSVYSDTIKIRERLGKKNIVKEFIHNKDELCVTHFAVNLKQNLICGGMQSGEIMVWKYYPETNEIKEYWKAPTGKMTFKTYKESKAYDRRKSASMTVWAINK